MTPPFAVPPIVERALAIAAPLVQRDTDDNGHPVRVFFLALLGADQLLWELSEAPGLAETLKPENVAGDRPEWLPLAGACNGARLQESMSAAQRLVEVRHPSGYARGLPTTLLANVAEFLIDGAEPVILARCHPDSPLDEPDDVTLIVRPGDVLPGQLAALERRVREQMIEGDHGHVVEAGWVVGEIEETYATVGDLEDAFATIADLEDHSL